MLISRKQLIIIYVMRICAIASSPAQVPQYFAAESLPEFPYASTKYTLLMVWLSNIIDDAFCVEKRIVINVSVDFLYLVSWASGKKKMLGSYKLIFKEFRAFPELLQLCLLSLVQNFITKQASKLFSYPDHQTTLFKLVNYDKQYLVARVQSAVTAGSFNI